MTSSKVITVAGGTKAGLRSEGISSLKVGFGYIAAITINSDNNLYIADGRYGNYHGHQRIRKINSLGNITTVIDGMDLGDGRLATQIEIKSAGGIRLSKDGSVFFVDRLGIRKISPNGIINTVARHNDSCNDSGDVTEIFICPIGDIALDNKGGIYVVQWVVNQRNDFVSYIDPSGIISRIAGTNRTSQSEEGYDGRITPAISVTMGAIKNIAYDAKTGDLYISSSGVQGTIPVNCRISRLDNSGRLSSIAGTSSCGVSEDGTLARSAKIQNGRIAIPFDGSLLFTDRDRIRLIENGVIYTVAGGDNCYSYDAYLDCLEGLNKTNLALDVRLDNIINIFSKSDGVFYVMDQFANFKHVRKVNLSKTGFVVNNFTVTDQSGNAVYVFNQALRHERTLHPLTGATLYTFGYDSAGQLISIRDAFSNTTTIERNGAGVATAIVSPYGERTVLNINDEGYLSKITDPAGQATNIEYADGGLVKKFITPKGHASVYTHDALGRITSAQHAAGGVTSFMRGVSNNVVTVSNTGPTGRTYTYQVNNGSFFVPEKRNNTSPSGIESSMAYKLDGGKTYTAANGSQNSYNQLPDPRWLMQSPLISSRTISQPSGLKLVSSHDSEVGLQNPQNVFSLLAMTNTHVVNGNRFIEVYNNAARTYTATTPIGRKMTKIADDFGRTQREEVAGLAAVTYTYDNRGRLASASSGSGNNARTATFAYNAKGYLESITDPLGRQTKYVYDLAGRMIEELLPGDRMVQYAYDANGNLIGVTPPGKPQHQFSYTAIDQTQVYAPPSVAGVVTATTLYDYNLDRQGIKVTRPGGDVITRSYDNDGRVQVLGFDLGHLSYSYYSNTGQLKTLSTNTGQALQYAYDGNLITQITATGAVSGNVGYGYDNHFRVVTTTVKNSNTVNFAYDADGLLMQAGSLSLTRDSQTGLLKGSQQGVIADTLGYNSFGEPITYTAKANGAVLFSRVYSRDALGRITQAQETLSGTSTTYAYAYDTAGRLSEVRQDGNLVASYTYDANGNRLSVSTPISTTQASYDDQDRLLSYGDATYTYAPNGELQSRTRAGQTDRYRYDALGNLRTVTLTNGTVIDYVIDGINRRVGKKVNGTLTQAWLYESQLRPVAELDSSGNVLARFVYGNKINVPEYMIKGGITYRLLTDHLGSVRLVVNASTGAIAQRIDYDAWGKIILDTQPGFQPFGFAGGLYEPFTGLVRFGARDYDTEVGRWVTKDPIGFNSLEVNFYKYTNNSPINYFDPEGKMVMQCIRIAVTVWTSWNLYSKGKEYYENQQKRDQDAAMCTAIVNGFEPRDAAESKCNNGLTNGNARGFGELVGIGSEIPGTTLNPP